MSFPRLINNDKTSYIPISVTPFMELSLPPFSFALFDCCITYLQIMLLFTFSD